jgi:chromosomal replication initiation ATPase DnaA
MGVTEGALAVLHDTMPTRFKTALSAVLDERLPSRAPRDVVTKVSPAYAHIPMALVQLCVSRYGGMTTGEMLAPRRSKTTDHFRQIAMALCCDLSAASLNQIAHAFGKRDHTTVMYARDKVKSRAAQDSLYGEVVQELRKSIRDVHKELRENHLSDLSIRQMLQAV